jgi:hypothetical protein
MRAKLHLLALCAAAVLVSGFGGQDLSRERNGKTDELKNSVEGKAPPKLVASDWQNTKSLDWKALKGKVVVLDFWAFW